MPRAKGGAKTRQRRKKILKKAKGYVGGRSRFYRTAAETVLRAGAFAYRDRKAKKRTTRRLWIARINAACRQAGLTYSVFIAALKKAGISQGARRDGRPRPGRLRQARGDRQGEGLIGRP
jgi:large subunit ribosomal protein L20